MPAAGFWQNDRRTASLRNPLQKQVLSQGLRCRRQLATIRLTGGQPNDSGRGSRAQGQGGGPMPEIKLEVPGWLTTSQLAVLARLGSEVPKNAVLLDVGAFCGQASICLLEAAPSGASLVAIGAWDPPPALADRTPLRGKRGARVDCSQAGYEEHLAGHRVETVNSNRPILSIQQHKPDQLYDLIFLFEGYNEVPFEVQIDFWFAKLKPMGLLCGADFVVGFRDTVRTLLRYGTRKKVSLGIEQNIWQLYNAV